MEQVILKPLHHRQQESIGIFFNHSPSLNLIVKKLASVKWSQTNKCWYLPMTNEAYHDCIDKLKDFAVIDNRLLKAYIEKRKEVKDSLPKQNKIVESLIHKEEEISKNIIGSKAWNLHPENLTALKTFVEQLQLKDATGNKTNEVIVNKETESYSF